MSNEYESLAPPPGDRLANIALGLGAASVICQCCTGIPAVVVGLRALSTVSPAYRGRAWIGIGLGGSMTAIYLMAAMFATALDSTKAARHDASATGQEAAEEHARSCAGCAAGGDCSVLFRELCASEGLLKMSSSAIAELSLPPSETCAKVVELLSGQGKTDVQKELLWSRYDKHIFSWPMVVRDVSWSSLNQSFQVSALCPGSGSFVSDVTIWLPESEKAFAAELSVGETYRFKGRLKSYGEILGLSADYVP